MNQLATTTPDISDIPAVHSKIKKLGFGMHNHVGYSELGSLQPHHKEYIMANGNTENPKKPSGFEPVIHNIEQYETIQEEFGPNHNFVGLVVQQTYHKEIIKQFSNSNKLLSPCAVTEALWIYDPTNMDYQIGIVYSPLVSITPVSMFLSKDGPAPPKQLVSGPELGERVNKMFGASYNVIVDKNIYDCITPGDRIHHM